LDNYISEDNPLRVIDIFIDTLDLLKLGVEGVNAKEKGRPGCHPSTMYKPYFKKQNAKAASKESNTEE